MNLATGVALMGRKQAEALMDSTCVISRVTGSDIDSDTGLETPTTDTIYTGSCRLRFPFVRPEQVIAEGQSIARDRGVLSLPMIGSNAVRANDLAAITISPVLDPGTVVIARVESPFTQTYATARRFPVEVLS